MDISTDIYQERTARLCTDISPQMSYVDQDELSKRMCCCLSWYRLLIDSFLFLLVSLMSTEQANNMDKNGSYADTKEKRKKKTRRRESDMSVWITQERL